MIDCPYTKEFLDWAALDRHTLSVEDGVWRLTDPGAELRYYIRLSEAGYTLTFAERGGDEGFEMSAYDIAVIERYLTDVFGSDIRDSREFPDIMPSPLPLQINNIAPGYTLKEVGEARVALLNWRGAVRAVMYGDTKTNAFTPVGFSWIVDASLADLRASYLDPDGLPLFPGCLFGPGAVGSLGGGKGVGCQS